MANIMAYSWPSHCKRYLDAIEAEKRYLRSQQVCCGHGPHVFTECNAL